MNTIISRQDASNSGHKFFYTGRPCAEGHDSVRYTSSGNCVKCHAVRGKSLATEANRARNARLQGHFTHLLHPDDFEAARAYCQALDMARGRVPWSPPDIGQGMRTMTAEEIQAERLRLFPALAR